MSLRPLGHRILVKPDLPPEQSESGLILPQDRDTVAVSGVVVETGPGGSTMRYQARQRAIKDCLEVVESAMARYGGFPPYQIVKNEIAGLLGSSDPEREVHVWDRVAFPAECGLEVTVDGEAYVILHEDDVAVVVRDEEAAA